MRHELSRSLFARSAGSKAVPLGLGKRFFEHTVIEEEYEELFDGCYPDLDEEESIDNHVFVYVQHAVDGSINVSIEREGDLREYDDITDASAKRLGIVLMRHAMTREGCERVVCCVVNERPSE